VFRDGERRVIARLLDQPVHVLATGGGAFMDQMTRRVIERRGVSLWLRADLDVLVSRVSRRNNRPLLKVGDTRTVLGELIERRYPVYREANVIVESGESSPELTVTRAIAALASCPLATTPPQTECDR
jgi:shikimate kinase